MKRCERMRVALVAAGWFLVVPVGALMAAAGPADSAADRPMTVDEWNELGAARARRGEHAAAIEAFTRALRLAPESSDLLVNRGLMHLRMKNWEPAEADFTRAAEVNHEDTRAFLQRAVARAELGRDAEAFRDASRAVRMAPENPQAVLVRHWLASRLGRHDLGHTAGMTYIGIQGWDDPWSPYVALLNQIALRRAGNEARARDMLAEAAAMLPPEDWPYPVVAYLRGDLTGEELLAQATDRDRATVANYYIGAQLWLAGDVTQAKVHFDRVASDGNDTFIQHRLARDHLVEIEAASARASSEK